MTHTVHVSVHLRVMPTRVMPSHRRCRERRRRQLNGAEKSEKEARNADAAIRIGVAAKQVAELEKETADEMADMPMDRGRDAGDN